MIRGSGYIQAAFDKEEIKKIQQSFEYIIRDKIFGDFDGIACRGTSGLVIAPMLSVMFDKKLLVVRKENDNSHSSSILEGHDDINRYIVVDDFTASGRTIESIYDGVTKGYIRWNKVQPFFAGCFFWTNDEKFMGKWLSQKEKIANSCEYRYNCVAHGRIYSQRADSERKRYRIDTFNGYNDNGTKRSGYEKY